MSHIRVPPSACAALAIVLVVLAVVPGMPAAHVPASNGAVSGARSAGAAPLAAPAAAPTLTVDGATPAATSLSWTASTDLLFGNYTLAWSTVGAAGPWHTEAVITTKATTQFAPQGLSPGLSYWWQLTDYSTLSSSSSNVVAETQPAVASLSVYLKSATSAQFNWTNNASYGGLLVFGSYQVFESAGGSSPTPVGGSSTVATHTLTIAGLTSGASYSFYLLTTDCLGNCSSGPNAISATPSNTVTIGTPLPLAASVTETRPVVDAGQADLFTCTPAGGRSPFAFAWNFGNGTYAPGAGSVSAAFAANGSSSATVTVTCRITDSQASVASAAVAVTVMPDPVIGLVEPPAALDVNQSATFNASVSLGLAPYSVLWSFGDGTVAPPGPTARHAYAAPGAYSATCVVTDGTDTVASATAFVPVDPAMVVSVEASAAAAAPGTTLSFTAKVANGSGNYTAFAWNFDDGGTATGANASHAFVADSNYSVSVTVTDSNGASRSNATVIAISALTVTLSPVPTAVSTDDAVTFGVTVAGGAGGPYNVTWSFGDGSVGYGLTTTHRYRSAGSFLPTVTVLDRLGAERSLAEPAVHATAPPAPPPLVSAPVLLLIAGAVGLLVALVAGVRRRLEPTRIPPEVAGRVPPTDPARTVHGSKVCPVCGSPNLPIRTTCDACGASLRRALRR